MSYKENPLQGWIPYRLVAENQRALVKWIYTANIPFFDESLMAIRSQNFTSSRFHSVSGLESMTAWAKQFPYTQPRAIIFHISRCGSTLLSQLLSLNEKYCVLSEVPFFDELLRAKSEPGQAGSLLLRDAVKAAYGLIAQPRTGKEETIFIKTDSWHILFADLYRQLFPNATFILLYRSPDEVLRSHQKMRGMHAVQGLIEPGLFGFNRENISDISPDEYAALVFEKYLSAFKDIAKNDKNTLLLDYSEGIGCIMDKIRTKLGLQWEDKYLAGMEERIKFHSKKPGLKFEEEKTREKTPSFLEPAMRAYKQLALPVTLGSHLGPHAQ